MDAKDRPGIGQEASEKLAAIIDDIRREVSESGSKLGDRFSEVVGDLRSTAAEGTGKASEKLSEVVADLRRETAEGGRIDARLDELKALLAGKLAEVKDVFGADPGPDRPAEGSH